MSLSSTNKDRYLLVYILSRIFSKTGLKYYLDLNPDFVDKVQGQVEDLLWTVPDEMAEFEVEARRHVEEAVSNLGRAIDEKSEILSKKRKRLSENLVSDYENETANEKQNLETLREDSVKFRKQYVYRTFRGWKCNALSQKGKKGGPILITGVQKPPSLMSPRRIQMPTDVAMVKRGQFTWMSPLSESKAERCFGLLTSI